MDAQPFKCMNAEAEDVTFCYESRVSQPGSHEYRNFDTISDGKVHVVIREETVVDEETCKLVDLLIREEEEIVLPE